VSSVGNAIISGLVGAIQGGIGAVISAAEGVARAALSAAMSALGVHSPSKEFYAIGEYVVQGFVNGMTNNSRLGVAASVGMVSEALQAAEDMAQRATLPALSMALDNRGLVGNLPASGGYGGGQPITYAPVIHIQGSVISEYDLKQTIAGAVHEMSYQGSWPQGR
jgi:hypothetical protein